MEEENNLWDAKQTIVHDEALSEGCVTQTNSLGLLNHERNDGVWRHAPFEREMFVQNLLKP